VKDQGSFRKIQRQQLKKSLKGMQHQLFMATKHPANPRGHPNSTKSRPQTTAPQKQDKGMFAGSPRNYINTSNLATLFVDGQHPLVQTMPQKKSVKQLS